MTRIAHSVTRRQAMLLIAAGLAFPLGQHLVEPAAAARGWCRADPLLEIGGQFVHVYISSTTSMLSAATDKIVLQVTVPRGVRAKLEDILADFGEGYRVRFSESAMLTRNNGNIPVKIAVFAPATDSTLPVVIEFAPVGDGPLVAASAQGTANTWISLTSG